MALVAQGGVAPVEPGFLSDERSLSDAALDRMALAPDDRAVLEQAYSNSASRLREQLTPVCAAALGGRADLARAIGVDGCRHIIVNTAKQRGDHALQSARRVAAITAGDATPDENLDMTDVAFLAFAEESGRFESELAEAFGPEEARRIVNSPDMCFSTAAHQFAAGGP